MPIIADADAEILELFAGKQDIAHTEMRDGIDYIVFCERRYDDDTKNTRTTYYDIKQSAFDDIKGVFTGILRSLPLAKHLLLILWIREFQFGLGSLQDDDMYDFIQNTFAYSGVDINDETVAKEFFVLFYEGYLQETITGDDWIRDYSLSLKGKSTAEGVFETMKTLISGIIETPSIVPEASTEEKTKTKKAAQNREELEGRRLAAVKYVQKHPKASLSSVEVKFDLGEKTLSRKPYKDMIAKFARDKDRVPSTGKKSYLGKGEKASRSLPKELPDHRKSHVAEVDERLDGDSKT